MLASFSVLRWCSELIHVSNGRLLVHSLAAHSAECAHSFVLFVLGRSGLSLFVAVPSCFFLQRVFFFPWKGREGGVARGHSEIGVGP